MLELTLTTGTELKIGDDVRIVFRGDTTTGRMKVAVDAPKEKRIERVKPRDAECAETGWTVTRSRHEDRGRIVIAGKSDLDTRRKQG